MADDTLAVPLIPSQSSSKIFSIATKIPKKRKSTAHGKPRNKSKKLSLREAFTYLQRRSQDPTDLQKAVYSIAYLMEFSSDIGNKDLDGRIAEGLSAALQEIACEIGTLFVRDDILRLGGMPGLIRQQRNSDGEDCQ